MKGWVYDVTPDNKYRFILGQPRLFHDGAKPDSELNLLICFGINPSTAEPDNLDNTLKSVVRIALNNHYDGWMMCNIYPQRATDPNDMDEEENSSMYLKNLKAIGQLFEQYPKADLWAAWGTLITKREYLYKSLSDINSILQRVCPGKQWVTYGDRSKDGHPHHPLYLRQTSEKTVFEDMGAYIMSVDSYFNKKKKKEGKRI